MCRISPGPGQKKKLKKKKIFVSSKVVGMGLVQRRLLKAACLPAVATQHHSIALFMALLMRPNPSLGVHGFLNQSGDASTKSPNLYELLVENEGSKRKAYSLMDG